MSFILIDSYNFKENIRRLKSHLSGKKICIGLKDNAYGHGIDEIARLCADVSVDACFVKNTREAIQVDKYGFDPILILSETSNFKVRESFHYSVNSVEALATFPSDVNVHLKINTGMNRNGVSVEEVPEALRIISAKSLRLKGVFTHFSAADENEVLTREQELRFQESLAEITRSGNRTKLVFHCANSAASIGGLLNSYDMYRIGIAAYGYNPTGTDFELLPVMSLYAERMSKRVLNRGESVGYGSDAFRVEEDGYTVGTYDLGYGDGFRRVGANADLTVENGVCVLGRVSMDSFSANSSQDLLCVFKNCSRLAEFHNTIEYEILTSLSPSIRRIIV